MEMNIGDLIRDGEIAELSEFLDKHPSITESIAGRNGVTPFLRACLEGKLEIVKLLVTRYCSIRAIDYDKYNGAHLAAFYGHIDILEYLHSIGPFLFNQTTIVGDPPLFIAFKRGLLETADYLLDKTDIAKFGERALIQYARTGNLTHIKYLLDKGAHIHKSLLKIEIDEECKRMICYYHLWHRIKGYCFAHTYDSFIRKLPTALSKEIIAYL